jgi:hypothetical protein
VSKNASIALLDCFAKPPNTNSVRLRCGPYSAYGQAALHRRHAILGRTDASKQAQHSIIAHFKPPPIQRHGARLRYDFHLHMSLWCREKPNARIEALNLNDSQGLTRPGPQLFSPALMRIPRETK